MALEFGNKRYPYKYPETLVKNFYDAYGTEFRPISDLKIVFDTGSEELLFFVLDILEKLEDRRLIEKFEPVFCKLLKHESRLVKKRTIEISRCISITCHSYFYYIIFQLLDDAAAGVENDARRFLAQATQSRLENMLAHVREINAPQAHIKCIELWANLDENSLPDIIPYLQSDTMLEQNVGLVAALNMRRDFDDGGAALKQAALCLNEEVADAAEEFLEKFKKRRR